jgi:membrane associated rhomboid family serine protease
MMTEARDPHEDLATERPRFIKSLLFPAMFVVLIWVVKTTELVFDLELYSWGLFPKTLQGLRGIVFSPLIHGDFSHLISNTFPLLLLGSALFYFYRDVAFRVLLFSVAITGLWVWVLGRPSYHIGASGLIYSLAAFLFVSGVIRRHPRLMALSLLVVFLYGGMVWGIFPVQERVSWESHLMGMLSGILLAFFYRSHGPQRKKYSWELEPESEPEPEPETESASEPAAGPGQNPEPTGGKEAESTSEPTTDPAAFVRKQDEGAGSTQTGTNPVVYSYRPSRSSSR